MVRETRFSFDDGMNVNYPAQRETFDEDGLDDFIFDEERSSKTARPMRREPKRIHPHDRRHDHRHLAGGDWLKPTPLEDQAESQGNENRRPTSGVESGRDAPTIGIDRQSASP